MKVLSLFDGMACGMLAMMDAGVQVDRYVAFEIDKYAVQTSTHNFPMIEHRGDVFQADFTEFSGFDFLVGGSPCTYWSIAQKNNRETEASGMGWELFSQYVRALREAQPMYFIYENNKSMAKAIRESITETFGFEPICINSALVSAQNRQRLYWVGKRNADGTYSKVEIEQPEDRGILLRDILKCGGNLSPNDKSYALTTRCMGAIPEDTIERHRHTMVAEPVNITADGKAQCVRATCYKDGIRNLVGNGIDRRTAVAEPVNTTADGKARTLIAGYHKQGIENCCGFVGFGSSGVAEPVVCHCRGIGYRGRMEDGNWVKRYESREDEKANALTTAQTDSMVSEPIRIGCYPSPDGTLKNSQGMRLYSVNGKSVNMTSQGGGLGAKSGLYAFEVPMYAQPIEWDNDGKPTKAISGADGKTYPVFEVKDGFITIKDKQYPIKLEDGFYIIRKLTVSECKRLQTVPEWYEFPVSDSQAYKMLGNGWTVLVISHLIKSSLV